MAVILPHCVKEIWDMLAHMRVHQGLIVEDLTRVVVCMIDLMDFEHFQVVSRWCVLMHPPVG